MNKRGFGLVQAASVIAMAIITAVFFLLIIFQPSSVEVVKAEESNNVYARVVLDNLLALPVNNPPQGLKGLAPEATLRDYISFEQPVNRIKQETTKEIKPILDGLSYGKKKVLYDFKISGVVPVKIYDVGKSNAISKESCGKGDGSFSTAEGSLNHGGKTITVSLKLCEVVK